MNLIVADAQVAKDAGIGYVNLSNELPLYTNLNADLWNNAITSIKALGLKVYSSFQGFKELEPCVFTNNLDVIGLNYYPKLSDKGYDATLDSCREYLINNDVDYLINIKKTYNKPLWITETGSTRYENALSVPETFVATPTTSNIIQYLYHNTVLPFLGSLMYNDKPVIDLVNIFAIQRSTEKYSVLENPLAKEVVRYISNPDLYNVAWNFTLFPGQDFKNAFGAALLQYAQGKMDWPAVQQLFIDQWKTEKEKAAAGGG
jgi:hypothetical protein